MEVLKKINNFPGGWAILSMIAACILLWSIPFAFKSSEEKKNHDEVFELPGYNDVLPSKMYSGYIPTGNKTKMVHYWLIESENDPENDPLLLWLQGGPGASSMIGLFTEMGPFHLNIESFNVSPYETLKVFYNNYTWTKFSNMLFIEAPAGVGYSYWVDGISKAQNDKTAAADNAEFLSNFFKAYPRFKTNPFYITGESYAGVFIPTLAAHALKMKEINFYGVAVGNGCTGVKSEGGCGKDYLYWYVKKLWGHGQVSSDIYKKLIGSCSHWLKGNEPFTQNCIELMDEFNNQLGGFNIYHIYDECLGKGQELIQSKFDDSSTELYKRFYSLSRQQKSIHEFAGSDANLLKGAVNNYACGSQAALDTYLADPRVAKALNCKIDYTNQPFIYETTEESCFKYYHDLIEANKKILIYYGDTDIIVPSNGGEFWTTKMGLAVEEPWRSWTPFQDSLWTAGHVVKFEKNFTFLTVKGAGHMVPQFKPAASFYMMKYWLTNQDFPSQKF